MSSAASQTQPPVENKGGVIPYLTVENAAAVAEFYKAAFGAVEVARLPGPNGKTVHCHLHINGNSVMLSDAFPEHGHPFVPPAGFMLHQQVTGIDALFMRALAAGATEITPVAKQFWGDLYGQLRDPFGIVWSLGETPKA